MCIDSCPQPPPCHHHESRLKTHSASCWGSPTPGSGASHLPPGFNALVDIVGEGAAGDEAAGPLGHMQVAIFQHDLALADDHQGSPAQFHAFKDVILGGLETVGMSMGRGETRKAVPVLGTLPSVHWH